MRTITPAGRDEYAVWVRDFAGASADAWHDDDRHFAALLRDAILADANATAERLAAAPNDLARLGVLSAAKQRAMGVAELSVRHGRSPNIILFVVESVERCADRLRIGPGQGYRPDVAGALLLADAARFVSRVAAGTDLNAALADAERRAIAAAQDAFAAVKH